VKADRGDVPAATKATIEELQKESAKVAKEEREGK
jgi:hypothetical protein